MAGMEILTGIIYAALDELFEKGVLDLPPDEMESLECEMDIEHLGHGMFFVTLNDWVVHVWLLHQGFHAIRAYSLILGDCDDCGGRQCVSDLKRFGDRVLCSYCKLKCEQCQKIPRDQKLHQVGDLRLCGDCIVPGSLLQAIYNI